MVMGNSAEEKIFASHYKRIRVWHHRNCSDGVGIVNGLMARVWRGHGRCTSSVRALKLSSR
jgi:hypothetical protein